MIEVSLKTHLKVKPVGVVTLGEAIERKLWRAAVEQGARPKGDVGVPSVARLPLCSCIVLYFQILLFWVEKYAY